MRTSQRQNQWSTTPSRSSHSPSTAFIFAAALAAMTIVASYAGPKKPPAPRQYEFSVSGAISTRPDQTAGNGFDQCRENGLDSSGIVQRKTTLDLAELQAQTTVDLTDGAEDGILRRAVRLDFDPSGSIATFSFWVTKNCQLLVEGVVEPGSWPLADGDDLQVIIPAGTPWIFNKVGGGGAACSGQMALAGDAFITVRRNDLRTSDVCDCPFDYSDDEADECD